MPVINISKLIRYEFLRKKISSINLKNKKVYESSIFTLLCGFDEQYHRSKNPNARTAICRIEDLSAFTGLESGKIEPVLTRLSQSYHSIHGYANLITRNETRNRTYFNLNTDNLIQNFSCGYYVPNLGSVTITSELHRKYGKDLGKLCLIAFLHTALIERCPFNYRSIENVLGLSRKDIREGLGFFNIQTYEYRDTLNKDECRLYDARRKQKLTRAICLGSSSERLEDFIRELKISFNWHTMLKMRLMFSMNITYSRADWFEKENLRYNEILSSIKKSEILEEDFRMISARETPENHIVNFFKSYDAPKAKSIRFENLLARGTRSVYEEYPVEFTGIVPLPTLVNCNGMSADSRDSAPTIEKDVYDKIAELTQFIDVCKETRALFSKLMVERKTQDSAFEIISNMVSAYQKSNLPEDLKKTFTEQFQNIKTRSQILLSPLFTENYHENHVSHILDLRVMYTMTEMRLNPIEDGVSDNDLAAFINSIQISDEELNTINFDELEKELKIRLIENTGKQKSMISDAAIHQFVEKQKNRKARLRIESELFTAIKALTVNDFLSGILSKDFSSKEEIIAFCNTQVIYSRNMDSKLFCFYQGLRDGTLEGLKDFIRNVKVGNPIPCNLKQFGAFIPTIFDEYNITKNIILVEEIIQKHEDSIIVDTSINLKAQLSDRIQKLGLTIGKSITWHQFNSYIFDIELGTHTIDSVVEEILRNLTK